MRVPAILGVMLLACCGGHVAADAGTPDTGWVDAGPPDAGPSDAGIVKAQLVGLVDMNDNTFHNSSTGAVPVNDPGEVRPFDGAFGGFVINVTWAQLQPDGGPLPAPNAVDEALQAIRAYNADGGTALAVNFVRGEVLMLPNGPSPSADRP